MDDRLKLLDEIIEKNADKLVADLAELIKIPSKKLDPDGDAPFGVPCKEALIAALEQGERMGFSSVNLDNYIGWIEAGQGDEMLGILAHLDVVPEGDGWTVDPFGALVKDGFMYGRGTQDDKGPALAALYGLKAVLEAGYELDKRVRIILGCDEESGSVDIDHYIKHAETPTLCFSPDADYPLVNCEKGVTTFEACAEFGEMAYPNVIKACGGTRPNVVAPTASAVVIGFNPMLLTGAAVDTEKVTGAKVKTTVVDKGLHGSEVRIDVTGTGAHGAMPWNGNNALTALIYMLNSLPIEHSAQRDAISELAQLIPHGDVYGKAAGIAAKDELSGDLTMNLGLFELDENGCKATVNIRYPVASNIDGVFSGFVAAFKSFKCVVKSNSNPHYVPEDSLLIKKLLAAYEDVTGLKGHCLSIGGGTYARSFPGGVSFGCLFEGGDDRMHQADERIPLEELKTNTRIMARAIVNLAAK